MAKFTLSFRLVETIMTTIMTLAVIGVSTQTFQNVAFPFDDGWDYPSIQSQHVTEENSRFYYDSTPEDCCRTLGSLFTPQLCHEILDMPIVDHQVETVTAPVYETTHYGFGAYDLPIVIYRTFDAKSANETVSAGNETIPTTTPGPWALPPDTQNISQINNILSGFRMYAFQALDPSIYRSY